MHKRNHIFCFFKICEINVPNIVIVLLVALSRAATFSYFSDFFFLDARLESSNEELYFRSMLQELMESNKLKLQYKIIKMKFYIKWNSLHYTVSCKNWK